MNRILFLVGISSLLTRCVFSSKKEIYQFENNKGIFTFTSTNPDSSLNHEINFWTTEFDNKEPISINFRLHEPTPNVEKLQNVKVELFYYSDKKEKIIIKSNSSLTIEFYNGDKSISSVFLNNKSPLNSLINWKDVYYQYDFLEKTYIKEHNVVAFSFENKYITNVYPDTLNLSVTLNWENGSRQYQSKLIKEEYKSPKINPKF